MIYKGSFFSSKKELTSLPNWHWSQISSKYIYSSGSFHDNPLDNQLEKLNSKRLAFYVKINVLSQKKSNLGFRNLDLFF